eukprot:2413926-Pyramimonas_sp.AAC.1
MSCEQQRQPPLHPQLSCEQQRQPSWPQPQGIARLHMTGLPCPGTGTPVCRGTQAPACTAARGPTAGSRTPPPGVQGKVRQRTSKRSNLDRS